MKRLLLPLLLSLVAVPFWANAAEPNTLTDAEKADGWQLLFDGKNPGGSFRNYKKDTISDKWIAQDGALTLTEKGGGDIITKDQYESFELSIEWKISEGGNSGIMFKVQEADGPPYKTGPEAQIQDNTKGKDPQKAGWMYQLYPASVDTTKPVGEWNHFVLKVQKTPAGTYKCEHTMNGTKYCEYEIGSADWQEKVAKSKFATWADFGKAAKGHICLQDHGNVVSFRNIKIKALP